MSRFKKFSLAGFAFLLLLCFVVYRVASPEILPSGHWWKLIGWVSSGSSRQDSGRFRAYYSDQNDILISSTAPMGRNYLIRQDTSLGYKSVVYAMPNGHYFFLPDWAYVTELHPLGVAMDGQQEKIGNADAKFASPDAGMQFTTLSGERLTLRFE